MHREIGGVVSASTAPHFHTYFAPMADLPWASTPKAFSVTFEFRFPY